MVHLEVREDFIDLDHRVVVRDVVFADLGGDEEITTGYLGVLEVLSDFPVIIVYPGGVDMGITQT